MNPVPKMMDQTQKQNHSTTISEDTMERKKPKSKNVSYYFPLKISVQSK